MLFATTTLAARIERAEAAVVRDFAERARSTGKDVLIEPVGGTHAVYGGPGEPYNKVVSLGLSGSVDDDALARLEAAYDARGAEIRVEQCTLADPSVGVLLTRRGYELIGYENVLGLGLTSALVEELSPAVREDAGRGITIERARPDQMTVWIETAIDGFLAPDQFDGPPPTETFDRETLRGVYADYSESPGTVLYFAHREGEIAGVGSARADDGLALTVRRGDAAGASASRCAIRPAARPPARRGDRGLRPRGRDHRARVEVTAECPARRFHAALLPRDPIASRSRVRGLGRWTRRLAQWDAADRLLRR